MKLLKFYITHRYVYTDNGFIKSACIGEGIKDSITSISLIHFEKKLFSYFLSSFGNVSYYKVHYYSRADNAITVERREEK